MFHCYFDDSGDQNTAVSRYVVVAGYVVHDTLYQAVNGWWRDKLLRHELPELHMRTIGKTQRERGWDDEKRNAVLLDFVRILREANMAGTACAIDTHAYDALPKDQKKIYGNAYDFGMVRVLRLVAERFAKSKMSSELVSCTFDQDAANSVPRLRRFFEVRKLNPWLERTFYTISFSDAERCYGLQMADMLAWEVRRNLIRKVEGQNPSARYAQLVMPLPGELPEHVSELWTAERFNSSFAEMQRAMSFGPDELLRKVPSGS